MLISDIRTAEAHIRTSVQGLVTEVSINYFSMSREVCEVIMSHKVLSCPFCGPGVKVHVDERYLTWRKYHHGRRIQTGMVTILGV